VAAGGRRGKDPSVNVLRRDHGEQHRERKHRVDAAEQAGGLGSDGTQNILDLPPQSLHQRTPFFVGSRDLVERAETYIQKYG